MKTKKMISLLLVLCLSLVLANGCQNATTVESTPSGTTESVIGKSITALMDLAPDSIKSIKIIQMGDGKTLEINNQEEIGRIIDRLKMVKITKDLGTQGYTLTGYFLEFQLKGSSKTPVTSIQIDSSKFSYHAEYDKHFFEISEDDASGKLNDYLTGKQYE